jgi:two-component system response regulator MprA
MKAERPGQNLAPAVRGERLLVVDDDPDVRVSLERALRCAGYAVTTAVHGADALDALARAPVDLIVLDVLMPMVDGFDACRRLRARGDATPILVLTARDAVDDRVAGLAAGADDYLAKPFALRELLLRNAEQVISYDVIRERVWGYGEAPASNALQVFVGFLRRKLEDGGGPRLLHNVRGVGYVIRTAP